MTGAFPSDEEILSAIHASGFLMEQDVATVLEARGFNVQTSMAFPDQNEGKSREMDVWAIQRTFVDEEHKFAVFCEIISECKNNSNPYVFITRKKGAIDKNWQPKEFRFPVKTYEARQSLDKLNFRVTEFPPMRELGLDEIHPFSASEDKAVQFCRIDRNGKKWSANHGGLYDATLIPLIKCLMDRQEKTKHISNQKDGQWRYAWFQFPVVVIRGKLFAVDSTRSDPKLDEVGHVPFIRDVQMKGLEGRYLVDFVREDCLDQYLTSVVFGLAERMADVFKADPDAVLTKDRAWREETIE